MNGRPLHLSIAAVERDCGLSKDTLRIWERRYGFPQPERDVQGERLYPLDQVERLRLIRRLIDGGHRPGRVVSLPASDLQILIDRLDTSLGAQNGPVAASSERGHRVADVHGFMRYVFDQDVVGLRRALRHKLAQRGLGPFACEAVPPFLAALGDAWLRGQIQVWQEHWAAECLERVLRAELGSLPDPEPGVGPRVLLTTFPCEPHALGLLLAETQFALAGSACISLGVRTPVWDIAEAARTLHADVVALSFSANAPSSQVVEGLSNLRSDLPGSVEIWAGGQCAAVHRRDNPGVRAFPSLSEIQPAVQRWIGDRRAPIPLPDPSRPLPDPGLSDLRLDDGPDEQD